MLHPGLALRPCRLRIGTYRPCRPDFSEIICETSPGLLVFRVVRRGNRKNCNYLYLMIVCIGTTYGYTFSKPALSGLSFFR